ncbi:MAG: LysR substrate-binding domain-containing protein [Pseudomonadota bacterium]
MDKFAELQAFAAVVEHGGFSAGARELNQSRSTTNRLVIALEERLQVQLLNRSTRRVSITSEGEAFYERARRILDDLEEAEAAVTTSHDAAVGQMRISAPLTFGGLNISKDVTDFLGAHPRLEIELNLETRMIDPVAEGYDVVVRVSQPDEETMLVDHRITSFPYIACAAPSYIETAGDPQHPSELRNHALLQHRRTGESRVWEFTGPGGGVTVPVKPLLCSNNLDPLRDAALAGLGIAVLPGFAIRDDLKDGTLRAVLEGYRLPERVLQVIYPPSRHLSAKVRLFTDFLVARYG